MKQFLIAIMILFTFSLYAQDKIDTTAINNGTALSTGKKVPAGYTLTGLQLPAMTASTTTIYLMVSVDGGTTYDSLYYDSDLYTETAITTGQYITLKYPAVFNVDYFKVGVNQSQTGKKTLKIIYTK